MATTIRPIYHDPSFTPLKKSFPSLNSTSKLNFKFSAPFYNSINYYSYKKHCRHLNIAVASTNQNPPRFTDHHHNHGHELEEILQTLPHRRNWDGRMLCQYQNNWFPVGDFHGVFYCQKNFKAHDTDIILATMPKAGTTWLKALAFTILNRHLYSISDTPLLRSSSHDLVPFLELDTYRDIKKPYLENIPSPRLFATHVPYGVLPNSIHVNLLMLSFYHLI